MVLRDRSSPPRVREVRDNSNNKLKLPPGFTDAPPIQQSTNSLAAAERSMMQADAIFAAHNKLRVAPKPEIMSPSRLPQIHDASHSGPSAVRRLDLIGTPQCSSTQHAAQTALAAKPASSSAVEVPRPPVAAPHLLDMLREVLDPALQRQLAADRTVLTEAQLRLLQQRQLTHYSRRSDPFAVRPQTSGGVSSASESFSHHLPRPPSPTAAITPDLAPGVAPATSPDPHLVNTVASQQPRPPTSPRPPMSPLGASPRRRDDAIPSLLSAGMPSTLQFQLHAYDALVASCSHLEVRLHDQNVHLSRCEAELVRMADLEARVAELETAIARKDKQMDRLQHDLATGAPVRLNAAAQDDLSNAVSSTLAALRADALGAQRNAAASGKSAQEVASEEAALAAMPGWSLDGWLGSLNLQSVVSSCTLDLVRSADGMGQSVAQSVAHNPAGELRFMQQLGKIGSRETLVAMLASMPLTDFLADAMWQGVQELTEDREAEVARTKQEAEGTRAAESLAPLKSAADAARIGGTCEEQIDVNHLQSAAAEAEEMRRAAKAARAAEAEAAAAEAANGLASLSSELERREGTLASAMAALNAGRRRGAPPAEVEQLHTRVVEAEDACIAYRQRHTEAMEAERARTLAVEQAEADAEAEDATARLDEQHAIMDARQLNEMLRDGNTRELSYARPSVFFAGLASVVGRPGAEPGEEAKVEVLMKGEHTDAADSVATFEAPNYLITTSSRVEWYAAADPEEGIRILNLRGSPLARSPVPPPTRGGSPTPPGSSSHGANALGAYPLEKRPNAPRRTLVPPEAFQDKWDVMNERLEAVGEGPLRRSGFISLRLYTGPMYVKYNTVLRGISVGGTRAPLEKVFHKLCHGNRYTNTLHTISASIAKLSRVAKCDKVYRAPGGVLPTFFWEEDAVATRGGVEMGFMSTSRSKHAAMEYAKMSGVKLVFEIDQGMVARGADVSWLSMYPAEDEVLFPPLCACEVRDSRIEGSIVVVELTPGVAASALQEASLEEQRLNAHAEAEKRAREEEKHRRAIEDAANAKAAFYAKVHNLKVSVADSKRRDAENRAVRAETLCFAAKRRAAASEAKLAELLQVQKEVQEQNLDAKLKASKARELQDKMRAARREEQLEQQLDEKERLIETRDAELLAKERELDAAWTSHTLSLGVLSSDMGELEAVASENQALHAKVEELDKKWREVQISLNKANDLVVRLNKDLLAQTQMTNNLLKQQL